MNCFGRERHEPIHGGSGGDILSPPEPPWMGSWRSRKPMIATTPPQPPRADVFLPECAA